MNVFLMGAGISLDAITATPDKVLSGYSYNDSDGEKQTGTMADFGELIDSVDPGETYENANPGYYSKITIHGQALSGNAEQSQVLQGSTFYSSSSQKQTGTMPNKGSVSTQIEVGGNYNNTEGYYSSIDISGPTLSGNATTAQVLSGQTFYNTSGTQCVGAMTNHGELTGTLNTAGQGSTKQWINGTAGYYSKVSVGARYNVDHYSAALNGTWTNSKIRVANQWYGARSDNEATSFKIVNCGGYLWYSRNQGTNSTIHIYYMHNVD